MSIRGVVQLLAGHIFTSRGMEKCSELFHKGWAGTGSYISLSYDSNVSGEFASGADIARLCPSVA